MAFFRIYVKILYGANICSICATTCICVWCSEFFKVKENMHRVKTRTQIVLAILTPQKTHTITMLSAFDKLF